MIQFLLLLAGEQARGSWQHKPPVTNAWLPSLIPPLDNRPNPPGGIAEHGGNLIWRVALLDQPQDVEVAFARRDGVRFGSGRAALPLSGQSGRSLF
jgi:hypothetical protein